MLKAREILRLKYEAGLSLREIGNACNCGKSTVSEVLDRAEKAGVHWPITLCDKQLMSLLYPPVTNHNSPPEPDMAYVFYEMKKKSVTLMLLWEEYKDSHPGGLMYTQFCERYRKFKKSNQLTMHWEHKAGEEMQVDWAGQTMSYVEPSSGEKKPAYLFVAVLPASAYPFAYAYSDTKLASWLDAHVTAFEYFGGVPKVIIPDNTKTAVITPDLVDPVLNKSYHELARHYRTTLVPARAGRPKDKAADENMVGNLSRQIIARLRNRQFFSLQEVNQAIREALTQFIERPFQKMAGNRRTAFEQIDQPVLQPLSATRYEYAAWKEAKIQFHYHVEYENFYYSVHHSYIGRPCSIRATTKTIEIYVDNERIAAHMRNHNIFKRYTTLPEHMPQEHQMVSGWSSERYIAWAKTIGPYTQKLIEHILASREYAVQSYRACMGLTRLAKQHTADLMETASQQALEKQTCSYKYVSILLKQLAAKSPAEPVETVIAHDNVRGSSAYVGGGLHVQ